MSKRNDEEWIKKNIIRIQDESGISIHSNGIPHTPPNQIIIDALPDKMRPLYVAYIKSILKPKKTDDH